VDDSKIILYTLSLKLRANGYVVLTAEDGSAAVSLIRRELPDLIVLDISYPPDVGHGGGVSWDGFLILNWVKRIDEAKNIPVFMISSSDESKWKSKALDAGVTRCFHKPLNNDELLAAIDAILGQSPASPQAVVAA
jgi:DNA-binding response OmpR family regulator